MENSQGDKVPTKIVIGPPLPPVSAVSLSRQRESLELGESVGDSSVPLPSQDQPDPQQEVCSVRQNRRSTSEVCKDLEAQLRGLSTEDALLPETFTGDTETLTTEPEIPETLITEPEIPETLTTEPEIPETLTEAAVQGAEAGESLSDQALVLDDRRVLSGDAEDLRVSFSQDFGEQRCAGSPVPELPPLEQPELWLPSEQWPAPPCQSSGDSRPASADTDDSSAESDEYASPFEELLLPPPSDFDFHGLLSGAQWTQQESAVPQWQEAEAEACASNGPLVEESSVPAPLQVSDVQLRVVEQQPGAGAVVGETAPRQLLFEPQWPLSALVSDLGPRVELDEESDTNADDATFVPQAGGKECEEVYVLVQEPGAQGYARLVPPPADADAHRSTGTAWCCPAFFLCAKREPQQ